MATAVKVSRLVGLPWLGWCRVVEVAGGRAAIVAFAGAGELLGVWVANDRERKARAGL